MFDFVDNQIVRIILEIAMAIITGIFGFLYEFIFYYFNGGLIKLIR